MEGLGAHLESPWLHAFSDVWLSLHQPVGLLWPRRSSAADRIPGSRIGQFCALVWPAREAVRPVTIFSRHLPDQWGRFAKQWNENSSDMKTHAHGAEAGTDYIQYDTGRPQCVQQTNMQPAYYMQKGCNRPRTSPELPQWNPLASLVTFAL